MKRFWDRTDRALDAVVVALAVPAVAIAATFGPHERDMTSERTLQTYRAALARCGELSGPARGNCVTDARATRGGVDADVTAAEGASPQSARVADVLARAQCDVLSGYATERCARITGPHGSAAAAPSPARVLVRQEEGGPRRDANGSPTR